MSIKYLTNIEVIGLAGTLLQILCQTSLINPLKAFVLIVILLRSINKKKYLKLEIFHSYQPSCHLQSDTVYLKTSVIFQL